MNGTPEILSVSGGARRLRICEADLGRHDVDTGYLASQLQQGGESIVLGQPLSGAECGVAHSESDLRPSLLKCELHRLCEHSPIALHAA
jgi:hypothetical protein